MSEGDNPSDFESQSEGEEGNEDASSTHSSSAGGEEEDDSASAASSSEREEEEMEEDFLSHTASKLERWISFFAILGDSPLALAASFGLFLATVVLSLWMGSPSSTVPADPYALLGPVPDIGPTKIFTPTTTVVTDEMKEAYRKDGVIAVRGLIPTELLHRVQAQGNRLIEEELQQKAPRRRGKQFFTANHSRIFYDDAFLELAVNSTIPLFAAELLGEETSFESLRIMRDIFLSKDDDPYICGWHVDDLGFWPATPESFGINAWIALDDMPSGGFAVAVGSHTAPWKRDAQYHTGASTFFPPEGYHNASDSIERRVGSGTCNLKTAAPHLHKRMEETKRIYDIQAGDVVFHTRWLFHRTVALNETERELKKIYKRYSVRYGPGTSVIPPGYGTELSVLWDETNGGITADAVCAKGIPWYPQAWPQAVEEEVNGIAGMKEALSVASEQRTIRQKEIAPLVRRFAKKHNNPAF